MPIETFTTGDNQDGDIVKGDMFSRLGKHGIVAYTDPLIKHDILLSFALNADIGIEMAVDATFGGAPIQVHNGEDASHWSGSNISGTKVTFNSTDRPLSGAQSIKVDNPALNDTWEFDSGGSPVTVANYSGITLQVNVDKDWTTGDSISICAWDVGGAVIVGNQVLIEDYFDEFSFDSWQTISIPFIDLGLTTGTFDAIRMSLVGRHGKAPLMYIDDIQVEESGSPKRFDITAEKGFAYLVDEIRFTFVGPLDTALVNATMPNLSYNKILGLTKLNVGIGFNTVIQDETLFSAFITCLGDSIRAGGTLENMICDGTNTSVTLTTKFVTPVILDPRTDDRISVTVADDLSSLISFTCVALGRNRPLK